MTLSLSTPSACLIMYKAVASPVFHPSLPRKPREHRPGHDFAQPFDCCIPVAAACVGLRRCASHSRRPKGDSFFILCRAKQLAADRRASGSTWDVGRIVGCSRVFVSPCSIIDVFPNKYAIYSSIISKGTFSTKLYSHQIDFILSYSNIIK